MRKRIAAQLRDLGVSAGDTVLIRASLTAIGRIDGDLGEVVLGGLRDAVDSEGTLMAPAFTKIGHLFSKARIVFDPTTSPPSSGAIAKLFLRHPEAARSMHPSHSFAAIGPRARELLAGHGPEASCFQPVKRLAEIDGKMLLIGCNNESPGFSTVHVAQFELGLSQRHWVHHFQRGWIEREGRLEPWRPQEEPGCSLSFDKFYPAYIRDQNLRIGEVGQAYSLLVPSARRALQTEIAILRKHPTFVDCGRRDCLTCGFRGYQPLRAPRTLLSAVLRRRA